MGCDIPRRRTLGRLLPTAAILVLFLTLSQFLTSNVSIRGGPQQWQQPKRRQQAAKDDDAVTLENSSSEAQRRRENDDDDDDDDDGPPSCRTLMQTNETLRDGAFLTSSRPTWIRRLDGSRILETIPTTATTSCHLHRYTAPEARQCLAQHHALFVGDSLTRYQYLSLVYLLHTGAYPPRFGMPKRNGPCTHYENNTSTTTTTTCATTPNIVMEGDFVGATQSPDITDSWEWYHAAVGGWTDGGVFEGQMECNCARSNRATCGKNTAAATGVDPLPGGDCWVENMLYYYRDRDQSNDDLSKRVILSFAQETGWFEVPRPLLGFNFTHCGAQGTCRRTVETTRNAVRQAFDERQYDWNQSLTQALQSPGGALIEQLPAPIDITLYNRGLWNALPVTAAQEIFPLLRQVSQVGCFYKTTTGCQRSPPRWKHETEQLQPVARESGCGYYDVGMLTQEFSALDQKQEPVSEYLNVFWDSVHFQPWVYEELNNVLLNILCNAKPLGTTDSAASSSAST